MKLLHFIAVSNMGTEFLQLLTVRELASLFMLG